MSSAVDGKDAEAVGHPAGRLLMAFRFDTRRALLRSIALAVPLMSIGATAAIVGSRLLQQREPARRFMGRATFQLTQASETGLSVMPLEQGLMVGGLMLVVLSHVVLILSLRRNLSTERFILLRTDGMVRQVDTLQTHVAWDDVEQVAYDAVRSAIVLEMREGGEVTLHDLYAGISREALAQRMRDVHRKAIWGLLRR